MTRTASLKAGDPSPRGVFVANRAQARWFVPVGTSRHPPRSAFRKAWEMKPPAEPTLGDVAWHRVSARHSVPRPRATASGCAPADLPLLLLAGARRVEASAGTGRLRCVSTLRPLASTGSLSSKPLCNHALRSETWWMTSHANAMSVSGGMASRSRRKAPVRARPASPGLWPSGPRRARPMGPRPPTSRRPARRPGSRRERRGRRR